MKKIKLFLYILVCILLVSGNAVKAEEEYSPHPIVFVHGLGGGYTETWEGTRGYFYENYFGGKYSIDNISYLFPVCDYTPANMDLTAYPVLKLMETIDRGIDYGFPSNYKDEKKVVIVAHSMGGLVIRSLLKQDSSYQNKINRVVFLGTPHQGSPLASAYWLINEESKKLDEKIKTNSMHTKNALGHLYIGKYLAYQNLLSEIRLIQDVDLRVIKTLDIIMKIKPEDVALKQLRIPSDISSQVNFIGIGYGLLGPVFPAIVSDKVEVGHLANGDNKDGDVDTKIVSFADNNMLATPKNFSTIKGTGGTFWGSLLTVLAKFGLYRTYSGFPTDNTLSDLITGDGIVTQYSQTALEGSANVISKYVSHLSEPNEKETILQAIEDKPVIERIKAVAIDESERAEEMVYYIVVKVKEYLLADIELENMELNGNNIIPESFNDNGKFKPYKDFGKKFLKSREGPEVTDIDGNTTKLKLEPGDFYVKTTLRLGKNTLKLKIKNPAEEYAQNGNFTDEVEVYFSRTKIEDLYFVNDGALSSWDWCIDVPMFDEEENPERGDVVKNYGTLKHFTVRDELFRDMKLSLRIWHRDPIKNFIDGQQITLSGSEGNYYKEFQNFIVWYGKDDNGRHVSPGSYTIQIITQPLSNSCIYPHKDPPVTEQLLLSTNLDVGEWAIISADPTFIQPSRRVQVEW